MPEKGVKWHSSSWGRKDCGRPSYTPRLGQFSQSFWSEESIGDIYASEECQEYLDQF